MATRLKSWDDPKSKKDDDEVTVYGVNSGYNMIIYNTSMTSLGIYGMSEKGKKRLKLPRGITANPEGDVYVADTGNDRIVRLFNPKKQLRFVTAIGGRGSEPGQLLEPHDVALDSRGFLYVADTGNHRVQVFDPENEPVRSFGEPGKGEGMLWRPTAIAVTDAGDRWSYYKDEFVVVVDLDRKRLQKFWPDGSFVKAVQVGEIGADNAALAYVAIDYYSNVWATDQANHVIYKFDRNLNYLASFGRYGTGDREFVEPRGISIYRRFGQVLIAERNTAQYYWIGTDIRQVEATYDSAEGALRFSYFLTEPSYVTLEMQRPEGGKTPLLESVWRPAGPNSELVDGAGRVLPRVRKAALGGTSPTPQSAEPVEPGHYAFFLRIEPTYSSYRYFRKDVQVDLLVP